MLDEDERDVTDEEIAAPGGRARMFLPADGEG